DKGYWDNGCSRHMTCNISYLSDYEPFDGGYMSFGQRGCKITGKGTIKTDKLEFENVYFVKDLKTPRQHNMYSIDLNKIVPHRDLTCLVAKASPDECMLWHRRLEVKKDPSSLRYIALPNWAHDALLEPSSSKPQDHCSTEVPEGSGNPNPTASTSNPPMEILTMESPIPSPQDHCSTEVPEGSGNPNPTASTSNPPMEILTMESPIPSVSSLVLTIYSTDSQKPSSDARLILKRVANQEETPSLDNILSLTNRFEDILGVTTNSDESNGVEADISNMEIAITASPTPTLKIHKDHPKSQIIGSLDTLIQTRNKSKEVEEQSFIATIHQKTDPSLFQFCLFSCFLSQVKPKKISDALQNPSWVLKNKKDERWIVIRNKASLVAQGHTQEEGIDYDEVFAPVARIEAIRFFLAYASFMAFTLYQMDVKSAFLYGIIDEEVYVMQPPGFQDLEFLEKVYKVEKAMYGLHQAPRAWYGTLSKYLLKNGFQRGTIDQTLFIRRQRGDFILVQVYVDDIIFGLSNLQLCREFKALMHEKFQMSAMAVNKGVMVFLVGRCHGGVSVKMTGVTGDKHLCSGTVSSDQKKKVDNECLDCCFVIRGDRRRYVKNGRKGSVKAGGFGFGSLAVERKCYKRVALFSWSVERPLGTSLIRKRYGC
nr:hypothetical protein [Tanacetum cinerariifolium]